MIDVGIPNLSTPAAIIDRIIIEKLKIKEFSNKEMLDKVDETTKIVDTLFVQLKRLLEDKVITDPVSFISEYTDYLTALTISVGEVSYFENTKALEHKRNLEKDIAYIAHMDKLSRQYCEYRSAGKAEIDKLFEKTFDIKSLKETRTF